MVLKIWHTKEYYVIVLKHGDIIVEKSVGWRIIMISRCRSKRRGDQKFIDVTPVKAHDDKTYDENSCKYLEWTVKANSGHTIPDDITV